VWHFIAHDDRAFLSLVDASRCLTHPNGIERLDFYLEQLIGVTTQKLSYDLEQLLTFDT
jgi:hypothetical protein